LHGEGQAFDVAVERIVEVLFGDGAQRRHRTAAGVHVQHVNAAGFSLMVSNRRFRSALLDESAWMPVAFGMAAALSNSA
jgi:hypothetical protein